MREGRVIHPEGGRPMTKQSDQGDADINVIVRRARQVGMLPPGRGVPRYGDFTGVGSFHESLTRVQAAEEEFMLLPAAVRSACDNDVGVFLGKVYSEGGLAELLELGLDPGRVPEAAKPAETPPAQPAAPAAEVPPAS